MLRFFFYDADLGRFMPHSLPIKIQRWWLLPLCILALTSAGALAADPMVIKYINRGALDARHAYIYELIKTILEETKAEFGDYKIQPYENDPGGKRISILIKQGDQINLTWASPGTVRDSTHVIPIPVDLLRGLLGYRVCLINSSTKIPFDKITDASSLNKIRLGQGHTWEDIDIYAFNNINVVMAPTFEGLLTMLALKRFDCLALGANEAVSTYREYVNQISTLAIDKNILIHYDYPIYFYIAKKYPRLAERFKSGMEKIQANGKFMAIFNQYFREDINTLDLKNRRMICLKSPFLPLNNQCPKAGTPDIFDAL